MFTRLLPFVVRAAIASAAVLSPLQAADTVNSPQIGKVLVVKKQVEAHRQAKVEPLKRKSPVFHNDKIVTGEKARSQFRLKDGTLFTLGERSEMVINQYKFEKGANSSTQPSASFELVKGVFRAVTGEITKVQNPKFRVKTPLGVIGIRGTDFWGGYLDPDKIDVLFVSGEHPITVENQFGKVTLLKPGLGTTIETGKAPEPAKQWPKAKVDRAVKTIVIEE